MKMEIFPLLTFSYVVFLALTLIGVSGAGGVPWYATTIVELPLYSKDVWAVKGGDIFLVISMGLLFVELIRATKTGAESITNHLLSFILFFIVAFTFILAPGFGNSVFFIFVMMTFLDPMAGLVVTTVTARRDLALGDKTGLLG